MSYLEREKILYTNNIINNYQHLKTYNIAACVKSNAYGHGDLAVVNILYKEGCRRFCISSPVDGIKLRENFKDIEIICFSGYIKAYHHLYVNYNLIPAVLSLEQLEHIKHTNLDYWLHVDVGINRTGIPYEDSTNLEHISSPKCIMTHLSASGLVKTKFTPLEYEKTKELFSRFHCLKSFAKSSGLYDEKLHFNIPRIGHALYFNIWPELNQLDTMSMWSTILQIKTVKKGDYIGYNNTYEVTKTTKIAMVNSGYAHGIHMKHPYVIINGIQCPVVGTISMEMTTVDVSEVPNISVDDQVWFFKDNWYEIATSIPYGIAALAISLNPVKSQVM